MMQIKFHHNPKCKRGISRSRVSPRRGYVIYVLLGGSTKPQASLGETRLRGVVLNQQALNASG